MDSGMTKIGVVFTSTVLTTKSGKEYFSGKTEGAGEDEFDLMVFKNKSKGGKPYLSIMQIAPKQPTGDKPKEASDEEYWDEVLK